MKRFWVGLKNKKVLVAIFIVFFSFFSNNFVNAIDLTNPNSNFVTPDEVKKKAEEEKRNREIEEKRKKDNQVVPTAPTGRSSQPTTDKTQQDVRNNTANNDRIRCEEAYKKAKASGVDEKKLSELKQKCSYSPATNDSDWTKKNNEAKAAIEEINKQTNEASNSKDKNSCDIEWVGWIACPLARASTGIVVGMYNFMQDNFLNIKSDQLFSNSGKGAEVYKNWSSFRDMANVFFVIMIAIIIFSQVTSAGISNYGIKKMLPKIIIYAILVNISWYLAVIAVDISNIAGSTIFNWLVKDGWHFSNAAKGTESPVESILTGTATNAGLIVAAGVTAALVGGGTILLFMISAVMALVTTLLILMIREAAVVVLVVISPLAFVMGLLPNTEGFLKKWMRFMKNMLIIYPICSLMVGGAIFVSNLLFNITDKPILKVMYGVLPILSLFAIVAIIKTIVSVIDGLTGGNLRGALGKMSGHINAAAQDSNWARASRAKLADRTIGGIAIGKNARNDKFEEGQYERDKAALEKLDKKKNKTAADYRRRARYGARVASYEKSQNEGMVAAMTYSIGNDSSRVNDELDKISEVKDPGQQRLMYGALAQAVTSSGLNSSGQATAMNSIAQSALNISDEGQRKAVAAQIASRAGSDFKKVNPAAAKAVMQDFSNPNSLKNVAQMEGDISTYSGASAKQMADWATMSSSNVSDNKAIKAMQSAFNSGDQSKILQAQNMGKIAEQALTANANGTMSLTPDQQANFMAMQNLAQSQVSQTATATTSNNSSVNTQSSPSQKVELTVGQSWQTSAPQQAQTGSSASISVAHSVPPAQASQASQPINNSNQNIQPRQTAGDPTKSNRKYGAN